jgi:ABC-type uncharacterized transport system fused permease/ATPase subunit
MGFMSLSHFAEHFWTYAVWSLEFLFVIPRILIIVLIATISLALACWTQRPFQNPLWKNSYWFVLTQLLFFPIVISIGVLYPANGPSYLHPTTNSVANNVCGFLGLLSLALAAFWVYRMKGFRWFAVSLVTILEMILFGAFFVAGMAITGDWL